MGIERVSLELPAGSAPDEAEKKAAAQLRSRGGSWSDLSLQTVLTTDEPGVSRYTFTYWVDDHTRH
ncbi:MAG: hypothetical protein EOP32_10350 [Rhodococcus sp. (in: high G+C Gram-positive bacteria)]|nr:MAG: hypothetical protein EOP32_10350 [Rhodococcus sp. (in: high G+C Gram-positive bacteria)]